MKKIPAFFAAATLALVVGTPALAANGCKDEIAKVEKQWASHVHEVTGETSAAWNSVEGALKSARTSCEQGKDSEAFETVNLVNRWIGGKEHTQH